MERRGRELQRLWRQPEDVTAIQVGGGENANQKKGRSRQENPTLRREGLNGSGKGACRRAGGGGRHLGIHLRAWESEGSFQ